MYKKYKISQNSTLKSVNSLNYVKCIYWNFHILTK